MKKKTSLMCAVTMSAAIFAVTPQVQAFGLGNLTAALPGSSTSNAVSSGDVDVFIKTAKEAELMIDTAANYIFKAVANKEEISKYEEALKVANSLSDPKEKEAKLNQIEVDRDTYLQKSLASKETEAKVKSMSGDQLKHFGNAGFTFMLGLLKDRQLAEGSTNLISGVSANPMLVSKLVVLKDTATSITSQVKSAGKIGEGLLKLAKVGNINIMPTSASEKPKEVSAI